MSNNSTHTAALRKEPEEWLAHSHLQTHLYTQYKFSPIQSIFLPCCSH